MNYVIIDIDFIAVGGVTDEDTTLILNKLECLSILLFNEDFEWQQNHIVFIWQRN